MCDSGIMDFSAEDDMLGEFDNIEEIMTKIDPFFLDEFMNDFTKDNTSEASLILGTSSDNISVSSLLGDDVENKILMDNNFPPTHNFTTTTKDPVLLQTFQPGIQTEFVKTEPVTPPSQPVYRNSKISGENKKNGNVNSASQPAILISTSNFCNIKPATERNQNVTQYQNIKPISVQNNFSVMPQVVSLQGINKDNSIFVQTPTVMYTKTDVQPVTTTQHRTGIKQFPNTKTLVFVEADSKVPIHRVTMKNGRVGKRLAHNATEKKYRLSISSGIETLKNLVVGDDAKLQKSAILRKAVDFIHLLQKQNRELQRQNIELMKAANISNVKDLLLPTSDHKFDYYGTLTPPRSDVSNSPSYSDHSPVSSPYSSSRDESDNEMTTNSSGMAPQERVIMCVFMLALVVVNPFGSFLSRFTEDTNSYDFGTKRNILSINSDYDIPWFNFGMQCTVWFVNCVILLIGLIRLLIYGDPVLSFKSSTSDEFWKHSRHAETEYGKGNGLAAYSELNRCLQSYGLFLPTTKRECFTATVWQFIRLMLHRIWIGRYLSRKAGGLFCTNEKRLQSLNSAKELALVFHRLNQIHLSLNMEDSHGLYMSLYAVNMAEVASSVISPVHMVEIYMTAALRVKESYPKFFQFFSRYYLSKAKQQSSTLGNRIPIEFQWVFTPYGYSFFVSHSFVYNSNVLNNESMFSRLGNKVDPMSYVIREYYEHLLGRALQSLVGTGQLKHGNVDSNNNSNNNNDGSNGNGKDNNNGTRNNNVLHYTQLLMDSINVDSAVDFNCRDKLAHWWASIFGIAKYWILGENESAEELYSQINTLPYELLHGNDSLPKAFFYAFQVKRAMRNKGCVDTEHVYSYCLKGSNLLSESLNGNKGRNVNGMKVLVQFLTCNWLLETRNVLWELKYTDEKGNYMSVPGKIMSEFQRDLNSLKIIAEHISNAESRVNVYEAIYRLMAGAAPGPTQELLNRNMFYRNYRSSMICGKDRNQDWDGGEREKADAIFIANKHLPTNLFSDSRVRRGHLMEAINIFEKIGDKNRLDECNKLLSSIGSSASN